MGKLLIVGGVVCVAAGLWISYGPRMPYLGKLPGDIRVEKDNFSFYFPLTTSILVSVVLSLILYLVNRWKN